MFHHIYLIRSVAFLGLITITIFLFSISMDIQDPQSKKYVYSVWALPQQDLIRRLKSLMGGLRSEFGGPEFEPHVTAVGAISLTESEARDKFAKACHGLKAYNASVEKVETGTFYYQCVFLLLSRTPEIVKCMSLDQVEELSRVSVYFYVGGGVVEPSAQCSSHFGYKSSTPYMPHLSLLYADLTEEEKKRAQEKASALDKGIGSLTFQITRLALYKTDTEDKSLKSWEKVAECELPTN
ncbi:cyclic phosphodiesterase-like isoform X1 [Apium graveolens]|uniref:cyclic phosphodiesterase-like isoform X1 n=1 Tax=Apium graveolens TaxID=4045 RepID=UPI003D7B6A5C